MNTIQDNAEDVTKDNNNNLKTKETNSSFENYDDDELYDIINKDLILHFPEEKTSDDIKKLYEEFHLEGTKEIKKDENDKEIFFEKKLESDIEEILIEIFNNRIKNDNKKNYSLIYESKNKIKNISTTNRNNFYFKIISILLKKLSSLIVYIKNKINFEKIEKSELDNIRHCLFFCSQDIYEIFDPSLYKIEKSEIDNILLKLFNDNILSDGKIINILKVKDELNLKNKFEISNNIDLNYNDVNKKKQINNNNNTINKHFIYNNNNRNVINGVITSNTLLKGYQGIKKYENIDDLVEYINEEDKKKKSRKKKKKNKNKNNEKEINENIIKGSENNENIEVEIQDPIVENFKQNINNFSFNDSNKKIKPIFSKKWLKNLKNKNN